MRKGFYEADVRVEFKEKKDRISQEFIVDEGPRSFIDSTLIRTGDPSIAFLIQSKADESYLKKGIEL